MCVYKLWIWSSSVCGPFRTTRQSRTTVFFIATAVFLIHRVTQLFSFCPGLLFTASLASVFVWTLIQVVVKYNLPFLPVLLLQSVVFYSLCCFIVPGYQWISHVGHWMDWIELIWYYKSLSEDGFTTQSSVSVPAHCTADMSLIWSGSEDGVLCVLHTVLWVLISVLFCQGKASLPLSAVDLADCSNCGCMFLFWEMFSQSLICGKSH